jgi:hypothetical protein
MAKGCKKCSAGVYGIDDAPYMEIAGAVLGGVLTGKVDEMATQNEDGTPKDNYFANNPTIKNVAYLAGGIGITAFIPGGLDPAMRKTLTGVGMGVATYAGYQLVQEFMKPDSVSGLVWKPPTNINGLRTLPGNYGIAPTNIAGINYQGSNYAQENTMKAAENYSSAMKMPLNGLVRAL